MSSLRSLQELPDPKKDAESLKNVFITFQLQGRSYYLDQLQEVADRARKVIDVHLDHILTVSQDRTLVDNVRRNAARYIRVATEVLDTLIPPCSLAVPHEPDVFDVIEQQRRAAMAEAATREVNNAIVDGATGVTANNVLANVTNLFGNDNNGGADGMLGVSRKSDLPDSLLRRYEVVFIPLSTDMPRRIRDIRADDVGGLVSVTGLVARSGEVRPRLTVAAYSCQVCGADVFVDVPGLEYTPLTQCPAQRCRDNKRVGKMIFMPRLSRFTKAQAARLQELPGQVPPGAVPRTLPILCLGERARQLSPGQVVIVSGIFLPVRESGFRAMRSGLQTETNLHALTIRPAKPILAARTLTDMQERWVRRIARDVDPYSRLASSIAPEIFGQVDVKKALLLQLVGGFAKVLPDGMRLRGSLHILLVGDPGLAKSQLLRAAAMLAPRSALTTGKGSSGAGLTAALVRDTGLGPGTGGGSGEPCLEAGALLLAHEGLCAIDEFDKMNEHDRSSIHEVMEQQTLSIAKAHFVTTLQAHTSILAAANPLYGRFNHKMSLAKNIDLPNSLLSRFDLVFVLLDTVDVERDTALSKHVLQVHKDTPHYRDEDGITGISTSAVAEISNKHKNKSLAEDHEAAETRARQRILNKIRRREQREMRRLYDDNAMDDDIESESDADSTADFDQLEALDGNEGEDFSGEIPPEVFKHYIHIAQSFEPQVPPSLAEYIVESYVSLRAADHSAASSGSSREENNQAAMTARQLLSTLRLSQALARLRLSDMVSMADVNEAIRITHASKASLTEATHGVGGVSGGGSGGRSFEGDPLSLVFNLLRSASAQSGSLTLDYADIEARVARQGLTPQALANCLEEYSNLGVLHVDRGRTKITLDA